MKVQGKRWARWLAGAAAAVLMTVVSVRALYTTAVGIRVLDSVPAAKLGCVVTGAETDDESPYGYGGSYYNYSREREAVMEVA